MDPRRSTSVAVAALVLVSVALGGFFGYLLGRGRAEAPGPAPTPARPTAERLRSLPPPSEPEAEAPTPTPEETRRARRQQVRLALHEVEAGDAEVRAWGLRTLLEAGYDHEEIVRLVLRPKAPGWQGRALADLLSSSPNETLPPLLHHLTYAAPMQRETICDALGAPREDTRAASAVLAVRVLLDSFSGAREHALGALQRIDPAAATAVSDHFAQGVTLADGSVAGLDASLLVEEGCPFASGLSQRAFLAALEADGDRFGSATVIRVGAFLAPLPNGEAWFRGALEQLIAYSDLDEEGADLLVTAGPRLVPLLRRRLQDSGAQAWVAEVLGLMGPYARDAAPDLLQVVVERRPIWRAALRAAARLVAGDASRPPLDLDVDALTPRIHDEEMGAHVAWALGALGATSSQAVDALCVRLAHRITRGLGAVQAEGALERIVAAGYGFERVAALLESGNEAVVCAAIRILALCPIRDRDAALARLDQHLRSDPGRAVRRTLLRARTLLTAEEEVREAERRWRLSALARALEDS